ncbi:Flp pilus assembly protein TadG [Novosphingobium hassiacum]|uniref:Flp pilus assembly protein TadG n=1 Tax=Novosphingobium hassiacum TaxID=173676 RepID=A0A7W5ZWI3_9SPHN|nr:TadE family protein [Novosphingobium hassiacum]MBB3861216.1 Flp pilus assembly protein TadG [Novosphingobium hassiacum]
MTMRQNVLFRDLGFNTNGSVVTEFALIAPTLIAMMLGVLQIGLGMQNYNALRSIASDTMRFAVVDFQSNPVAERVSSDELAQHARDIATRSPYGLKNNSLSVNVATVTPSRVANTLEKSITLTYSIPTVLAMIGIDDFTITYSQPIFLVED